jgi:HEAT repeat protein
LGYFDQALKAGEADAEAEEDASWNISRMARRMRARILYRDAPAAELLELTGGDDPEVASEARRLLATQRDAGSVAATREAWSGASSRERTEMLRELVADPSADLTDLFKEALQSPAPEDIQLGARAIGQLGDHANLGILVAALERGILSTEYALVDGLRRLGAPGALDEVSRVLTAWEERDQDVEEDDWHFSSDTAPLRHLLYTAGDARGRELLVRDMSRLKENDLWDKTPSGGPVSAALTIGSAVTEPLLGLLGHDNPAARRWAAYCLAQLKTDPKAIAALCDDSEQVVRLQAASALAWLGDTSREDVVLKEMEELDPGDLPFALHFLVPFKSGPVKTYLLDLLNGSKATTCEVLPLLGRQEPDEEVSEILSMSLMETNDDTRAGAVTGLAYQGGAQSATRLRLLYDQEDSDEVLRRVIFGLGQLAASGVHRDETIAFLRERMNRSNPRLRFAMALTLLRLDDTSGIDLVRERAALFNESLDRYDLVAPALKALADYDAK